MIKYVVGHRKQKRFFDVLVVNPVVERGSMQPHLLAVHLASVLAPRYREREALDHTHQGSNVFVNGSCGLDLIVQGFGQRFFWGHFFWLFVGAFGGGLFGDDFSLGDVEAGLAENIVLLVVFFEGDVDFELVIVIDRSIPDHGVRDGEEGGGL